MCNENKPNISVIVPVYNVEKYLKRCVDSILNQTLKDIEIILVNDGSTDNSLGICINYQKHDTKIKVINKVNEGVSSARNAGIDVALGEYITFVDSDDWIDNRMYEVMYNTIIENNVDAVNIGYSAVYGKKIVKRKPRIKSGKKFNDDLLVNMIDDGTMTGFLIGSVCMVMFKRNIIIERDIRFGINIKHNEDGLFNLLYLLNSKTFYTLEDETLYYYEQNNNSSISKYTHINNNSFDEINGILFNLSVIYPQYNFQKQLLLRNMSIALWSILSECDIKNTIKPSKIINNIKQICNDPKLDEAIETLDFNKINIYKCFFAKQIKKKRAIVLFIATRYIVPILQKLISR